MRIRVAGIIPMEDGFALMHRIGNKVNGILDYHVFPGGGLEEGETLEEGIVREIKEEFGINVKVKEKTGNKIVCESAIFHLMLN